MSENETKSTPSDWEDEEELVCAMCHEEVWLRDGDEPTKYCDHCAHELLEHVDALIEAARECLEQQLMLGWAINQSELVRVKHVRLRSALSHWEEKK